MMMRTLASAIVALSLSTFSASAKLLIDVNKSTQTLTVIRDGRQLYTWPVSTGKTNHPTPSGNFTAFRLEADHFSKEWDDAPMPHSIFFTKQGHAIHGSFDIKRLGSPVSHGCVRLAPENAAALFALVSQEGLPNTQVVLNGSEQVAIHRLNALQAASGARRPVSPKESAGTPRASEVSGAQVARSPPQSPGFPGSYLNGAQVQPPYADSESTQQRYVRRDYTRPQSTYTEGTFHGGARREPPTGERQPYAAGGRSGLFYFDPYDGRLRYNPGPN